MRLPGTNTIVTVDPENVKAILATQFNDFGKGAELHGALEPVLLSLKLHKADFSYLGTEFSVSTDPSGPTRGLCYDPNSLNNEYPTSIYLKNTSQK
jgi:hypothetical protein